MKRVPPALILLVVAVLAYGLLIPQLGIYWDDLPMSWIRYELGPEAMTRYFSTNRPVWGLLYQVTTRLLPQVPAYWQIFALLWRWLGAVAVWVIVRQLWKARPGFALSVALLFLLYPGFNQQWGSYLYSHFFIVLFFFLFSIFLMLRSVPQTITAGSSLRFDKTIAAMFFSALNLWMMEYFFPLEFARVGFIWTSLRDEYPNPRDRVKPTLKLWAPYLAVFALAVLSRLFIFNNQIYGFGLMSKLKDAPLATLLSLVRDAFSSLWVVTFAAWAQAFQGPNPAVHGRLTLGAFAFVCLATAAFLLIQSWRKTDQEVKPKRDLWFAIGLGLFLLPFAGAPFWLTGLSISLSHPASRFTLPFMLAVSLIFAALIELIPWPRARYVLLALLIGLAAGRQFLWSTDYVRDWQAYKNLFWQMTWRVPALKPNTVVLMNEELSFYADNSLSPTLNWIYAPEKHSDQIDYVFFYPTNRLDNSLPALEPGLPIDYDYIAGHFIGNTSQAVAFYYDPPACLRLLEPDIDTDNRFIQMESLMREASALSNSDLILASPDAAMPAIYQPEPAHGWCYYFQKADLARQLGNWETVTRLGDEAFALSDYPNNPLERFVFIEGYAHTGKWERAVKLSRESYRVSKEYVGPLLCRLWGRIETETSEAVPGVPGGTTAGVERDVALSEVENMLACNP
ncbi:MAG: hypothetical protein EHM40_10855 [Chloroflexi bacterium]|nr:MAG: hypothetical protein EHM40_10855 [Chloroflexota bacterium]